MIKLKLKRPILLVLKLILFILMTWFIANQLFIKNDFKTQYSYFLLNLKPERAWLLILAILMMPVNWGLEAIKWRMLLKTKASFSNLIKSIVAGITIGFVTPGRSGEFVGRAMFLDDDNKAKVFYLSSIGGLAQTAASLLIGIPVVYFWRDVPFLFGLVLGAATIYLFLYFRFDLLNKLITSVSFLRKYGLVIEHKDLPAIGTQSAVLLLSGIRFLVYSLQYVVLLVFFGISGGFIGLLLLWVHAIIFLLAQTVSPMMPLLDISVRGGIALLVFKGFTDNNIAVLCSVMLVWLINLVLPALGGYLFILRKK
ncbi:MAG: hypothetical protein JWO06_1879 [Bacteroidota bacterium]|nr:hypothetical protein [Bacteroidota bacterium]